MIVFGMLACFVVRGSFSRRCLPAMFSTTIFADHFSLRTFARVPTIWTIPNIVFLFAIAPLAFLANFTALATLKFFAHYHPLPTAIFANSERG
jgi:hypothetical protein